MRTPIYLAALACTSAVAVAGATEYAYDDGVSNVLLGPPSSFAQFGDIDMLWGNYFYTDAPSETLTSVSFGMGNLSSDPTVSVWVFNDADNDGDPTNAVPVFSTTTTAENLGFDFNVVDVTPTEVTGGFFVAIGHLAVLGDGNSPTSYPAPARFDPDGRADRSWFFYDNDIPENDLASSGFVSRMDGPQVPIQGAFAIRATTIPAPAGVLALAGAGLVGLRRRR